MIALKPALSTIWAALAATVSASCCVLPMALLTVGFTSLGPFAVLMRYRPLTLTLSAVMLAGAFYVVYRRQAELDCREGRCSPSALRRQRFIVWIAAVLMLVFAVISQIPMEMRVGG